MRGGHRSGPFEVVAWLMSSYSNSANYRQPLLQPVIEGLQTLEHAGMVTQRRIGSGNASTYQPTRLGESSLAEGSVRQQLG